MLSYPPHRTIASLPVPQEAALKFLSAYLSATATAPYLLPNAKLESSGPAPGSSNSSVTIHNLQRVEAGLRGEWLAPVIELEGEEAVNIDEGVSKDKGGSGEGWQDLQEYQREQEDLDGEIAPTTTVVAQGGEAESGLQVHAVDRTEEALEEKKSSKEPKLKRKAEEEPESQPTAKKPKDKEAKKQAKKERLKQEKRDKEEQRKVTREKIARSSE